MGVQIRLEARRRRRGDRDAEGGEMCQGGREWEGVSPSSANLGVCGESQAGFGAQFELEKKSMR